MRKAIRRRLAPMLGLALLLSGLLVACGGDSNDSGGGEAAAGGDLSGTSMTFVTYGGDQETAYREAYVDPFQEATGASVTMDSPTDYAKVKAQVESGNVSWDVMVGDPYVTMKDCGTMYEEIPDVNRDQIDPKYMTDDCSVPADVYATVLVYDQEKFGDDPPTGWADFFDTDKYPGKRGMWSFIIGNQLEHALQADGVSDGDLYPLDTERAFAKLDEIKGDISFYDTLAQSSEQLLSGAVSMSIMYAQRAYDAEEAGADLGAVWDGAIQSWDSFVIPKGASNLDASSQMLDFIATEEPQVKLAEITPFGPTVKGAEPEPSPAIQKWLSTAPENAEKSIQMDMDWWSKNFDRVNQEFTDWAAG